MGRLDDDLAEAEKKLATHLFTESISRTGTIISGSLMIIFILVGAGEVALLFLTSGILCGMIYWFGKDPFREETWEVDAAKRELEWEQVLEDNQEAWWEGVLERVRAEGDERQEDLGLAVNLLQEGGLANLQKVLNIYSKYKDYFSSGLDGELEFAELIDGVKKEIAQEKEKLLDYAGAIADYEELGLHQDAKRVRRKMLDEFKVDQTVVHGDYVDDRDTIVKDSVISKSNVGSSGKSKAEKLREVKALLDDGIIDDDDYEKMKREIIG